MKLRSLLFTLPTLIALAACTGGVVVSADLQARLENPLFAVRYWAELVERMTMMQIQKDPLLEDAGKASLAENAKQDALRREREAEALVKEGLNGVFIGVKEATEGQVLLREGTLWLGSTFAAFPGPSLHLYLTEVVDPRDVTFPDPSALDLGLLQSPYGDQRYVLAEEQQNEKYRTAVLWDTKLERLYGFAQLAR